MSRVDEAHDDRATSRSWRRTSLALFALAILGPLARTDDALDALAARVDPYVEKPRVFVLTDIANESDDQMSLVRFLVYSSEYEVDGLVATTSTWLREKPRPDVIHDVIDAYEEEYRAATWTGISGDSY
jgi:hypothetical protein